MNQQELNRFRRSIVGEINRIQDATEIIKREIRDNCELNPLKDEMDASRDELSLKSQVQIHNQSASKLGDLQAALARLDQGTFGLCQDCGDRIEIRRLEAKPSAAFCICCQDNKEIALASTPKPWAGHKSINIYPSYLIRAAA